MGELPQHSPEAPRPNEGCTAPAAERSAATEGFQGYVGETVLSASSESALTIVPDMSFANGEPNDEPPAVTEQTPESTSTPYAEVRDRPMPPAEALGSGEPPFDKPPTNPRETGGEGEEPLLPSTISDVQWEEWFGGQIIVARGEVRSPDRGASRSDIEVAKIYRPAGVHATTDMVMPSGALIRVGLQDIFQMYEPDASGALPEKPSVVFQFKSHMPENMDFPEGYYAEEAALPPELQGLQAALKAMAAEEAVLPQTPSIAGRRNLRHAGLDMYSIIRHPFHKGNLEAFSGSDMHTMYVHYPVGGEHMNLIMPGGTLLTGQSKDVVEQLRETPLMDGYEVLSRTRLGRLALQDGHIII